MFDQLATIPWRLRRVDTRIHPADEMAAYIRQIDRWTPTAHYLDSGHRIGLAVDQALTAVTAPPPQSVLEFACGYGRYTRHLIHQPATVTVSDIDADAVTHVTRRYRVAGFVSTADPADLDHHGRYDLIVVASLFSHLPLHRWGSWMDRLRAMLTPGGHVVASTNGPPGGGVEVEPGFWYGPDNETSGRLAPSEYGTTWVTSDWVRKIAPVAVYLPRALWEQDVYVIGR